MNTLKVIVFDIKGRFAHFRKFYTNSSSLTYGIPPRTTLAGIVAAILGYERDTYYEVFNSNNLYITSRKMTKTSKIIQTLNYIKATSINAVMVPKEHTQVPFEMLTSKNGVCFRIYLSHKDKGVFDEIQKRLVEQKFAYPPCLGGANFLSSIDYIDTLEGYPLDEEDYIKIKTPIRTDYLKDLKIDAYIGKIIRERMAVDFNKDRTVKEITNYLYDDEGETIEAIVIDGLYRLSNDENIVFM